MPKPTPHPNHNKTDAQFAKDWWSAERFRLLPGEQDGHTVFTQEGQRLDWDRKQ